MSTTIPTKSKPAPRVYEIKLERPPLDDPKLSDYAAEEADAKALRAHLEKLGAVSGSVTIGKQKFQL